MVGRLRPAVLALGVGCGRSAPGMSSASSTVAGTTTSSGSSSTGSSGSSSTGTDASTAAGTSTDGSSSADTSSTGDAAAVAYCLDSFIGGINRANVWRRDADADVCTLVRILLDGGSGWDGPTLEVTPPERKIERIHLTSGATDCGSDDFGGTPAITAEGAVALLGDRLAAVPDAISISAVLGFGVDWAPAKIPMMIEHLPRQDSCVLGATWSPGP